MKYNLYVILSIISCCILMLHDYVLPLVHVKQAGVGCDVRQLFSSSTLVQGLIKFIFCIIIFICPNFYWKTILEYKRAENVEWKYCKVSHLLVFTFKTLFDWNTRRKCSWTLHAWGSAQIDVKIQNVFVFLAEHDMMIHLASISSVVSGMKSTIGSQSRGNNIIF